ncbi:hypothetical protein H3R26_08005 [Lactobacillus sp. W8092]|nr:hypothetical protein [Lactobacillus sp. W8092]
MLISASKQQRVAATATTYFSNYDYFIGLILVILDLSFHFLRNTTRPSSRQYPVLGVSISDADGYQDFHLLQ